MANSSLKLLEVFFAALIILNVIEWSHGSCYYDGYKASAAQLRCNREFQQAYYEQTPNGFLGMCCSDRDSFNKQRKSIRACRTTTCVTTEQALCSTLNPVFIDGQRMRQNYEETLSDSCTDSNNVQGRAAVCCPRGSYDALHVSVSGSEKNEFPFMVSLGNCGGTVYNQDWVITAAHCVVEDDGNVRNLATSPMTLTIGTNLGEMDSSRNKYPVERIIIHDDYSWKRGHPELNRFNRRIYNDIALLKLQSSIDFDANPTIKSIQIAPQGFRAEDYADQVVIAGWGTTELALSSQHLQKSNLLFRDDAVCFDKRAGNLGRDHYDIMEYADQLLCIGGIVNNSVSSEAGRGDSGGPAVCRGEDGYGVLCGVTSFGSEYPEEVCVAARTETYCTPSVYADVGFFHDWITENAGEQDASTFYKRILYGKEVPEGKYTHQVHVRTEDGKKCGGTLVSTDTVVTAASCVFTDEKEERPGIKVDYPVRDISRRSRSIFRAKKVVHGPNFARYTDIDSLNVTNSNRMMIRDPPYTDNIAVIKLQKKVTIPKEQLARLPRGNKYTPGPAVETAFPLKTTRSGGLMERNFTILDAAKCQARLQRFSAININVRYNVNQIMCGVEEFSGGAICDREIGGGLMCKGQDGQEVFCGIQTFRMCETTLPSAFLFTGQFKSLIRDMINEK